MINAFAALVLAHLLGDFVLQSQQMAQNKARPVTLGAHGVIITTLAFIATGGHWPIALLIGLSHMIIDLIKTRLADNAIAFASDQIAHLGMIGLGIMFWPNIWETGWWAPTPQSLIHALIITSAIIAITTMGGHLIGKIMQDFPNDSDHSLAGAGRMIGYLERILILIMVLAGEPGGIGFLIAAKSILRFNDTLTRRASEYVIIGTLASFSWAMLFAFLTKIALAKAGL